MRDAIIVSGWNWDNFNVPERMALALARAGSRILYGENPVSWFRRSPRPLAEVEKGIFAFGLTFLGHRVNSLPILSNIQARLLANQILDHVEALRLNEPVFIYPHGDYCLALCRQFKRRGFRLIHICMDYELPIQMEHVRNSDLTLAIPRAAFLELKEQFGARIKSLPQFSALGDPSNKGVGDEFHEARELSTIPRPRLGYLGCLEGRVSIPLLDTVLRSRPEWQFLSFGASKWLELPNEHVLPWRPRGELGAVVNGLDVGFMPYDCADPKNLHCVPLKLFDYFARGMPVVSTPIVCLREYNDLVYLGATAEELAEATLLALSEPPDSPKKDRRRAIALEHSVDNVSKVLVNILDR